MVLESQITSASRGWLFALSLVAVCAVLTACGSESAAGADDSSSVPSSSPSSTDSAPAFTATPEPTPTPTPPAVDPIDAATIELAMLAYDADPQPTDLGAYDHLSGRVKSGADGSDLVELDVCGWTGASVVDDSYLATYVVADPNDDAATATFQSVTTSPGGCLNSSLLAAALEATRNYDVYWSAALANPQVFALAGAAESMTLDLVDTNYDVLQPLLANGSSHQNSDLDGQLPESSLTELLYRRYEADGRSVLQLAACRVLPENYGLYQGTELKDDFRDDASGRSNAIAVYELTVIDGEFKVMGFAGRPWASCDISNEDWLNGINTILPDPVPWAAINS